MAVTAEVFRICPGCGRKQMLTVDADGLERWEAGELIQKALPGLTAGEREVLKTGLCGECWDSMFADEDEGYGRWRR